MNYFIPMASNYEKLLGRPNLTGEWFLELGDLFPCPSGVTNMTRGLRIDAILGLEGVQPGNSYRQMEDGKVGME